MRTRADAAHLLSMMGAHHSISGAAAWIAITSTAPHTLGLHPLPTSSVVIGALVTAGAALLPDADHHNGTIAHSAGPLSHSIASVAEHMSGGHRHGMHSLLAVAGFTVGTVLAGHWHATVPVLGYIPAGSALIFLALIAFASKALRLSRGGIVKLWAPAIVIAAAVLHFAPEQMAWLPISVMVGVIIHLLGDMLTVGGVPVLWPWIPKPPKSVQAMPLLSRMWMRNGYMAIPVLGKTGSVMEWALCVALSAYTLYGLAATTGLVSVAA